MSRKQSSRNCMSKFSSKKIADKESSTSENIKRLKVKSKKLAEIVESTENQLVDETWSLISDLERFEEQGIPPPVIPEEGSDQLE